MTDYPPRGATPTHPKRGGPRSRRLPWEPAERIILQRCRDKGTNLTDRGDDRSTAAIVDYLGILNIGRETVYGWRRGGITVPSADRVAGELGYYPAAIWPEWEHVA